MTYTYKGYSGYSDEEITRIDCLKILYNHWKWIQVIPEYELNRLVLAICR